MKSKFMKSNLIFLLSSAWKIRKSLLFYYFANIILTLTFSLTVIIVPRELVSALVDQAGTEAVVKIAIDFLMVAGTSSFFLAYIKGFYIANLHEIRMTHLWMMMEKVLKLDYRIFEDDEFLNKIWIFESVANNYTTGVQGVLMRLFQISANIVMVSFYFGILFRLSAWVVLFLAVNIVTVFITSFGAYKFRIKMDKERAPLDRKNRYLNRVLHDFAFGKDVRIYGISNWLVDLYKQNFRKQNAFTEKVEARGFQVSVLAVILSFLRDLLIYGFLVYGVINGKISIADFTMIFTAVAAFTVIMQELSTDIAFVHSQEQRLLEYRGFLELDDEKAKSGIDSVPAAKDGGYEIEFRNVRFKYPKSEKYIYENLNLTINVGEKLAIVGLNGAGKTTLVKLLMRLYEPESGVIFLNGKNIRELDLFSYRSLISAVFQEITLFATTLAENLTLTRGEFDRLKLEDSMKKSGFYEKFLSLEKGYDTQVLKYLREDGIDFSGGERQKIAITRALYKNGSILVMDEPTAALDAIAEYNLYHELAEISRGKTVIFVSHRLASTRFCDRIALIGNGGIIEIGTHDELIKLGGLYREMFDAQAQYYKEDGESDESA